MSAPARARMGGNWDFGRGPVAEGTLEGDLSLGLCFATCQPGAGKKALGASEPQFPPLPSELF